MHRSPLGRSHRHGLVSGDDFGDVFDVCVIGSGASGTVAAEVFVQAGLRTLMLEEGVRLDPTAENARVDAAAPSAYAGNEAGGWNERGWPWTTRNLGGGTVFYGGASFRYEPFDFDPGEKIRVDGLEVRWPIGLADLEPFYAEMERKLAIDPAAVAPWASRTPPPSYLSLPGEHLWEGACRRGYAPRPTPVAIDRGKCDNCSLCISSQCTRGAKRDAVVSGLAGLADSDRFHLLTGVRALALQQTGRGRVSAVQCLDLETGQQRVLRAERFVLACNAIQTAALLLRSVSGFSPNGIGNEHDLVGRGLCMKLSEYCLGEIPGAAAALADHPIGYRGPFSTVAVLDHYLDPDCPTGVGGMIYETKPDDWRSLETPGLLLRVETILADHPSPANRVRLTTSRDAWGTPRVALDYTPDPRDLARLDYMVARSAEWLSAAGADDIRREPSHFFLGSTHLHGTCRAGTDPKTSVVDRDGRIHSVENVHVVDGSYMPYPGGLNPTLTIQANALRIARRMVAETAGAVRREAPATIGAH